MAIHAFGGGPLKRTVALAGLLGGVVIVAAAGYLAGTRVQSAAEIAARKSPPPPSVITVPVERTVLSTEVITRGTVQFGASREVVLPSSALKTGSRVVTSAATAGAEVKEGDVAMAISGRPVFVLQGAQPIYRDLAPGTYGEDVRQLETALARLGFDPGPVDGLYDGATGAAVARWYTAAGWNPQGPTPEQITARRTANADANLGSLSVLDAQEGVRAARSSLAAATAKMRLAELAITAAGANRVRERLAAEAEVSRLEGLLGVATEEAKATELQFSEAQDGIKAPGTPSELEVLEAEVNHAASLVALAAAEVEAARAAVEARGDLVGRTGSADVNVKQRARDAAATQLGAARARLNDARLGKGRPATPAELAVKRAAAVAARAAVSAAANGLSLARASLSSLPAASATGSAAAVELEAAQLEVNSARSAVQIAERRVGLPGARQPLSSGPAPELGFQVPADEVVFFPTLPLRVSTVTVRIGDRVDGPVMTLTNSRLVVSGALTATEAQVVKVGSRARIAAAELGVSANGTVAVVAQSPGTQGADTQRFYLEITPTDAPGSIVGASVVLTISVTSTQGEVLVVPVAALSVAADGTSRVQLQIAPGTVTPVTVRAGLAARGLVEVTPLSAGLGPGDLVVVGSTSPIKGPSK